MFSYIRFKIFFFLLGTELLLLKKLISHKNSIVFKDFFTLLKENKYYTGNTFEILSQEAVGMFLRIDREADECISVER